MTAAAMRSGLLPPPPPLPDELNSEDGDENKGLCDHKVSSCVNTLVQTSPHTVTSSGMKE